MSQEGLEAEMVRHWEASGMEIQDCWSVVEKVPSNQGRTESQELTTACLEGVQRDKVGKVPVT